MYMVGATPFDKTVGRCKHADRTKHIEAEVTPPRSVGLRAAADMHAPKIQREQDKLAT